MRAYIGEGHELRQKKNQRGYQRRILAWFGHYLKDEPAETWITEGKSFLERDDELKRLKMKKQRPPSHLSAVDPQHLHQPCGK